MGSKLATLSCAIGLRRTRASERKEAASQQDKCKYQSTQHSWFDHDGEEDSNQQLIDLLLRVALFEAWSMSSWNIMRNIAMKDA